MDRVLHIVSAWGTGGVERYLYNFSKYIDNYVFDILTLRESNNMPIFDLGKDSKIYNLPRIDANYFKRTKFRKKQIIEFLKSHEYKIIHFDTTTADTFILAKAIKKFYPNVKIIMHCHANNVEPPKVILKKIIHYMAKYTLSKYADYYIGVSKETIKWMYTNEIQKSINSTIITCGIETHMFKFNEENRNKIRKKYGLENKFVIGTVGRFSTQKNIPFIIKIIDEYSKINKKFKFVWVGNGKLMEYAKGEIEKHNLNDFVDFLGICNNIEEIYSAFDLFVLPSLYEGNPIVVLEAQINGLKCLLSNKLISATDLNDSVKFLSIYNVREWIDEIEKIRLNPKRINIPTEKLVPISVEYNAKKLENINNSLIEESVK